MRIKTFIKEKSIEYLKRDGRVINKKAVLFGKFFFVGVSCANDNLNLLKVNNCSLKVNNCSLKVNSGK